MIIAAYRRGLAFLGAEAPLAAAVIADRIAHLSPAPITQAAGSPC
jgi:hypothetical protein